MIVGSESVRIRREECRIQEIVEPWQKADLRIWMFLFYLAAENQRFSLVSHPDLPRHGVIRALNSPVLCYLVMGEREPQTISQLSKIEMPDDCRIRKCSDPKKRVLDPGSVEPWKRADLRI